MLWQQKIDGFHHHCKSYWITLLHINEKAPEVTAIGDSGWIQDCPIIEDLDTWYSLTANPLMLNGGELLLVTVPAWLYEITFKSSSVLETWILTSGSLQLKTLLSLSPFCPLPLSMYISLGVTCPPSFSDLLPCLLINERTLGSFTPWKINDLIWEDWLLGLKTEVLTP